MPKRVLTGKVISNKATHTVCVEVVRRMMHPIYKKFITKTNKYHAHDPSGLGVLGEHIVIRESIPFSKTKKWEVIEKKIN